MGLSARRVPTLRLIAFPAALALIVYAAAEASSLLALRMQARRGIVFVPLHAAISPATRRRIEDVAAGRWRYIAPNGKLGWTIERQGRSSQYCANAQGFRGERAYPPFPPADVLRIVAVGDSFTHGDEVENHQTWEEQLARRDGRLEVLNLGVPGYGMDQALLRFQLEAPALSPRIAVMGVVGADVDRHVNTFRPFLQEDTLVFGKPRFTLVDRRLLLVANPLPTREAYQALLDDPGRVLARLGSLDRSWNVRAHAGRFDLLPSVRLVKLAGEHLRRRRADADTHSAGGRVMPSDAMAVTMSIIEEFCREARSAGARPIVLFFPTKADLAAPAPLYAPLRDALRDSGETLLDLEPVFQSHADAQSLFRRQGHYGPEANGIVARALLDLLSQRGYLDAFRRQAVAG